MSVNLYNTGVSGILSAQQQLATTGHNIANVNTEGYSRQRAEQSPQIGLYNGDNYLGSGSYITDIRRIYDEFAQKEQMLNQTNLGYADGMHLSLDQLNNIISSSGESINSSIEQFYVSVNAIADDPSNLGLRNMALSQAGIVASNFNSISSQFDQLEKSVNGEIEQIAVQITEIGRELARINDQILQNKSFDGSGQPNDLLDSREKLIADLSKYTKVNAIEDQHGVMTVMIGGGTTLVAGATTLSVEVKSGDPDPAQTQLELVNGTTRLAIDERTMGGELGAKFEYRDVDLKQARADIDRISTAIAITINEVQAQGLDLNGVQGADIFNDVNSPTLVTSRIQKHAGNTGGQNGEIHIDPTALGQLSSDEFEIEFDGANYQLTNLNTGVTSALGAPGGGPFATGFGFDFVESGGAPLAGDKFLVRPGENSAALMQQVMTNGEGIAASSAVEISPSDDNISAGKIEVTNVTNPAAARALMPMRIEVLENPANVFTYDVYDNTNALITTAAYTPPAQTINIGGVFDVEITGTPSGIATNGPEVFDIVDAFGLGNGSNAFDMANTKDEGLLNNGRETFNQNLAISTATVGTNAHSAKLVADTADALFTQSFNRNQEVKGVNLDEEAANLLKFQQAYQASSKIISIASTIFDTLLNSAR
ncbi:flagellar hook-associated protein FlgK [Thalassotalea sp. M1531]|uniref:Flagellar hook-associated protein 1 n=1 Tax=Thalassotalea algicola TaxID=2716224 RepID=A0A7Y0Q8G4_9GAMM|nr:flagellar hook-associated protein FlgK [Thalassotalea algicola]NMP32882.1 flagellar hook-associated protein FlgK [Thalassotalea algicola]